MNSYLYIKVEGKNINKFLLKCNRNNINIINVKYISYKSIIILINYDDYKRLIKIKGSNKIKIIKSEGKIKYKEIIKKYKILIISFFVGILLLLFLSNIIFSVEVIGENNLLNEKIKKELTVYGIEKYKFKKNYNDINLIKKKIKEKYNDNIEWIEIKKNGVKYVVNFVERKVNKEKKVEEKYSIIAKKSGIIRGIYTYNGISLIQKGDYVTKGDILISSDIIINDEIKDRISSDGKVYAEVWYKVNISYPLDYYEKKYTSKKRKILYLKTGNKYIELFKFKNYDRRKIIRYKNKLTGIEFGLEEIKNVVVSKKKYTEQEALKKASIEAKNKLLLKLNDDEKIINEKTLKFYNNGSKIIVDIFFSVYEEIGEKKVIETGEENDSKNIGERIQ